MKQDADPASAELFRFTARSALAYPIDELRIRLWHRSRLWHSGRLRCGCRLGTHIPILPLQRLSQAASKRDYSDDRQGEHQVVELLTLQVVLGFVEVNGVEEHW